MNGAWTNLVSNTMTQDIGARREAQIDLSGMLKELKAFDKERRSGKRAMGVAAAQAAYSAYPEKAAEAMGMDIGGAGGTPEGMEPYTTKRGATTYKAPAVVNETTLLKMYQTYIIEAKKQNALYGGTVGEKLGYKAIPEPSLPEWIKENFPEYENVIRTGPGKKEVDLDDFIVSTIAQLRNQGKKDSAIIELMRKSKKYKDIDPAAYGLKMTEE